MGWFKRKTLVEKEEDTDLRIQVKALVQEKRKLKEELEDLKLKKRLEQEEITHMSRINEERMKQEVESEKLDVRKKYQEDINAFKEEQRVQLVESLKEFHTKMEKNFKDELASFKEMYQAILTRLPNVNYDITRHVGDPQFIEAKSESRSSRKR